MPSSFPPPHCHHPDTPRTAVVHRGVVRCAVVWLQVASLVEARLTASTDIVTDMHKVLSRVEAATAASSSSAQGCV